MTSRTAARLPKIWASLALVLLFYAPTLWGQGSAPVSGRWARLVQLRLLLYDRQGILCQKIIGFEYTEVVEADLKPLL